MFKHLPNVKQLLTFESAGRLKSYSAAANELCLSQAAVSQQMRHLELQLGYKLFYRNNKSMLLTQQGNALFQATHEAFSTLDQHFKHQKLNSQQGGDLAGELTVTTTQAFASIWLMSKLHLFSELHPDIKVNIKASAAFESLEQQGIDLAIRFGKNVTRSTDKHYEYEYFGEDHVYPVCSPKTAASLSAKQPTDLLKSWLVCLEHSGPYTWRLWFENLQIDADKQHEKWTEVNSTDVALNAVLNDHGVTLCVSYLCQHLLDDKRLVIPLSIPHPNAVKRYFVYHKQATNMARLKVFTNWLKTEMGYFEPESEKTK